MKLTPEQKIKILTALEEYKIQFGRVLWEFVIQDGRVVTVKKIREDETERIA